MTKNDISAMHANQLSDVPQSDKTFKDRFNSLQDQHNNLIAEMEHDRQNIDIETVRHLLKTISTAGTYISDPNFRSRLRGYIRFWAGFIHDQIGEYPVVSLLPSEYSFERLSRSESMKILDDGSRIGQIIDGYQLIEEIGRGGFSSVYLAKEIHTGDQYAVKLFERRELEEEVFNYMLKSEAMASHLRHPNILEIRKFGVFDNISYLVTDYIAAGSLAERLNQYYWRPQLSEVFSIFKQIASALQYLHTQGIVHRDVKPGNILIDYENRCYLSDFGVATLIEKLYGSTIVVGTPEYMAPETIRSPESATGKTDLYSFGVVMYQILNGSLPFKGNSAKEYMKAHLEDHPLPMGAEIPKPVAELVESCLSKDPEERVSANILHAMIVELESILSKEDLNQRITGFTTSVDMRDQVPHADTYDTEPYMLGKDTDLDDFSDQTEIHIESPSKTNNATVIRSSSHIEDSLTKVINNPKQKLGQVRAKLTLVGVLNNKIPNNFVIYNDNSRLGRNPLHVDLVITDQHVSRYHCQIRKDIDDSFRILDEGSTNGTYLNGLEVNLNGQTLHNGDIINLGPIQYLFERLSPNVDNYDLDSVIDKDDPELQIVRSSPIISDQGNSVSKGDERQLPLALLILLTGQDRGKLISVCNRTVIGSSKLCGIVLNDPTVSPQHLLLVPVNVGSASAWHIYDLASGTGTRINGEEITHGHVEHNNEISIGRTRFVFKRLDI